MANLVWLQGATDNGCTVSFLNTQEPDLAQLIRRLEVNIAFHPTINPSSGPEAMRSLGPYVQGNKALDVLIVEGAVQTGPNGTGGYCVVGERPFKEHVQELAQAAHYVVAIGTCASFGGIAAADPNPTEATGLQFRREQKGGFLGADYRSRADLPVVNIPGCPAHPDRLVQTLAAVLLGKGGAIKLDEYQRPLDFYGYLTHDACPNNEYFEYKQSAEHFTDKGCLFEELGCKGPLTHSDCNRRLWNLHSSKTRAGSPCMGCTEPGFPDEYVPFFETIKTRAGLPRKLPLGTSRTSYMAMAASAKLACPDRLKVGKKKK